MILVILGVAWAIFLVPPLLRARAENVSRDSIRDFSFKIGALGRANAPYRPVPFRSRAPRTTAPVSAAQQLPVARIAATTSFVSDRAAIRRRQVFSVLGLALVVTLMLAISSGGTSWALFGIVGALFVGYMGLVAFFRPASRVPLERLAQVRPFPPAPARPQQTPEYAYQRTVNS